MAKYEEGLKILEKAGLTQTKFKRGLFNVVYLGQYPFGDKHAEVEIQYQPWLRGARLKLSFPYDKFDQGLIDAYDKNFPDEVGMWGRSSPSFKQAIIDFKRGQSPSSPYRIELLEAGRRVEIEVSTPVFHYGEAGFNQAIAKLSSLLRNGPFHEDVLTHLFA